MSRPGLGYLPDRHDPRDHVLRLGAAAVPDTHSLRSFAHVLDQGPSETCVSNALAHAIYVDESAAGRAPDSLARLHINWHACAVEGSVFDQGCRIRDGIKSLANLGAPLETVWPFDLSKIAKRPSWEAEREGFSRRKINGYARVFGTAAIKASIAAGHPVVGGWQVDDAFLQATGPNLVTSFGAPVGGHALCIIGYDTSSFEIVNSWGTGWRDGGFCRFSYDLVLQGTDLWSVSLV